MRVNPVLSISALKTQQSLRALESYQPCAQLLPALFDFCSLSSVYFRHWGGDVVLRLWLQASLARLQN